MNLKVLKKIFISTFFLISLISTVAYADIIDNDTSAGWPYGNVNNGYSYLYRGYCGDSRISSDYRATYRWNKYQGYEWLTNAYAYLNDSAFTDTNAHYYCQQNFDGSNYLFANYIGPIDQCNAPGGWNICPYSPNMYIGGDISIMVTHYNGQTGADAIQFNCH